MNVDFTSPDFIKSHYRRYHPVWQGMTPDQILALNIKVPVDSATQRDYLHAMRALFLTRRNDEYCRLVFHAMMSESEIIERKPFYLALAPMLARHMRIAAPLADHDFIRYIAEDMVDGNEPELAAAGNRLQQTMAAVKQSDADPDRSCVFPEPPPLSDEMVKLYQEKPLRFLLEHAEGHWHLNRDLERSVAFFSEILELDYDSICRIFYDDTLYEENFSSFVIDMVKQIVKCGQIKYAIKIIDIFTPLCARAQVLLETYKADLEDAADSEAHQSQLQEAENFLPETLRTTNIIKTWKELDINDALEQAAERLRLTPDDIDFLGLLSEMLLAKHKIRPALAAIVRAWHRSPATIDILFQMAHCFHAGYFAAQVDLCMREVRMNALYKMNPARYQLPVEVFMKCDQKNSVAVFNSRQMGECPVRFLARPGPQWLGWQINGKLVKQINLDLKEATVSKFRYNLYDDSISDEISRCGCVTMYTANGAVMLNELVKNYLVDDLKNLPDPGIDEIISLFSE